MNKRLLRSRRNRIVAGVAGGLGHYLAVDPVFLRLALAMLIIYKFWLGLILYGLAAMMIPEEDRDSDGVLEAEVVDRPAGNSGFHLLLAISLILVGAGLLLYRFLPGFPALSWYIHLLKRAFWPLALIALGIWLIFRQNK